MHSGLKVEYYTSTISTSNKIINESSFYSKGDFEDITRVGKTMYILRSDATIFEIGNYEAQPDKSESYILDIPAWDNEGLCYDRDHNDFW
jgi:hypothetical protein